MKRLMPIASIAAAAIAVSATLAHAQNGPPDPKTGRSVDGLQNDAAIDKAYRAHTGEPTPTVKADPWAEVRTPQPTPKTAIKAKH